VSVVLVIAYGWAFGATFRGIWNFITKGSMKEFFSPEGRFCLAMAGLLSLVFYLICSPSPIGFVARIIEPRWFGEPKDTPSVVIGGIFLFFFFNVLVVGFLYYGAQNRVGKKPNKRSD
jgi:hypothetical protein